MEMNIWKRYLLNIGEQQVSSKKKKNYNKVLVIYLFKFNPRFAETANRTTKMAQKLKRIGRKLKLKCWQYNI